MWVLIGEKKRDRVRKLHFKRFIVTLKGQYTQITNTFSDLDHKFEDFLSNKHNRGEYNLETSSEIFQGRHSQR